MGTTSLVYHLGWMFADLGVSVVMGDLDPRSHLTSMCLDDERLEQLWEASRSLADALRGGETCVEGLDDNLGLLAGDLQLATDPLGSAWSSRLVGVLERAAAERAAQLVLLDCGADVGPLNRAALAAVQHLVLPVVPDLRPVRALEVVGPTLRAWQARPSGYVVLRRAFRLSHPEREERWLKRIPAVYQEAVLAEPPAGLPAEHDPHCLGVLPNHASLRPLAAEARKPMFQLKPADGAVGGLARAVSDCYRDFRALARSLARCCGFSHLLS